MKRKQFVLIILFALGSSFISAQEDTYYKNSKDTVYIDSLNRNLVGLNVFPALGMISSGKLESTKIFIQYKHFYEKMNLRTSINYSDFHNNNEKIDLLRMKIDTVFKDTLPPQVVDSMVFRKFYYDVFSYDFRVGAELAFQNTGWRFYLGAGLIGGIHNTNEYYYHYTKEFNSYPIENVNYSYATGEIVGYRKSSFVKTGIDLTVGVDIDLSSNAVISVQYAPEIVYYYKLNQKTVDPDSYFVTPIKGGFTFIPDYIDVIVSIKF